MLVSFFLTGFGTWSAQAAHPAPKAAPQASLPSLLTVTGRTLYIDGPSTCLQECKTACPDPAENKSPKSEIEKTCKKIEVRVNQFEDWLTGRLTSYCPQPGKEVRFKFDAVKFNELRCYWRPNSIHACNQDLAPYLLVKFSPTCTKAEFEVGVQF